MVDFSVIIGLTDDVVKLILIITCSHANRGLQALFFHGRLGQHQRLAAQDVVDIDALNRQHIDIDQVARGLGKVLRQLPLPSMISAFVQAKLIELPP